MESQGHGATPLTVTRGGSFAQHRFVHQLAGHHQQHHRHQQTMTMAPNGATAEAKRGPLPSGKA